MKALEKAEIIFRKSVEEALGYIELAQMTEKQGGDTEILKKKAIEALQRFSDDDDLVDALYENDLRFEDEEPFLL